MTNRPNIRTVLRAIIKPLQLIEDAYYALLTQNGLGAQIAVGSNLDVIGDIVGESRQGLEDIDYLRLIQARVAANRSRGTINDILKVASLVLNLPATVGATIVLDSTGVAAYELTVYERPVDDVEANFLLGFLQASTSGGVRVILTTSYVVDALDFTCAQAAVGAVMSSGATTVTVDSTAGFPSSGSVDIDVGTSLQETVTYSSKTSTTFATAALANNHAVNTIVQLSGGPGLGFDTCALLATGVAISATTLAVDSTSSFGSSGSVVIDYGLPTQESVSYTSKDSTHFLGLVTTKAHVAGATIEPSGLTTAGEFISTRDAPYP